VVHELVYVDYDHFHEMARRCSKHGDTIHFAYLMNWTTIVWGTCLIDYAGERHASFRAQLIDGVYESTEVSYTEFGWNKRIRLPIVQNPINTVNESLEMLYFTGWAECFFDEARKSGPACNISNVEHALPTPLANTGNRTVAFTWRETDIRFNTLNMW
jgi:hypothetical protein